MIKKFAYIRLLKFTGLLIGCGIAFLLPLIFVIMYLMGNPTYIIGSYYPVFGDYIGGVGIIVLVYPLKKEIAKVPNILNHIIRISIIGGTLIQIYILIITFPEFF